MEYNNSTIWTEKYRPKKFEEVVGQDDIVKKVQNLTKALNIPHMLFAGPAGTGKSTLALITIKELFGANWKENFLELNASVSKDTPILIKLNGKIKRTNFAELDKIYFLKNDSFTEYKEAEALEVLTLGKDYKVKWAKTSKIIRHKADKILRVSFEGGGNLNLTGNHSVMLLNGDGLISKKASEIKVGDYFLSFLANLQGSLNKLNLEEYAPKIENSRIRLLNELEMNDNLAWLFGLYTAEGSVGFKNNTSGQVIYTLGSHETLLINKLKNFINDLKIPIYENFTGSGFNRERLSAKQIRILNNQLAKFISNNFYSEEKRNARTKKIPEIIYDIPIEKRISYLKGLSDGDGCGEWGDVIRISSVSNKLLVDSVWLSRISGLESSIFNKEARIIWKGKMKWRKGDQLPSDIITRLLEKLNKKINGNWRYTLRHQLYEGKKRTSKFFLRKILEMIDSSKLDEKELKVYKNLGKMAYSDLHSLKIKKIEVIEYNDFVYDVSVPDNEMFFAGNIPVLLHNSDERGIDVVRQKVKDFARTKALGNIPFKIIFLDEADALTKEAQQALRRTMENFTSTCRFIMSCNYSSKIIDPIQSRCVIFRFKLLEKKDIEKRVKYIAEKERLEISEKTIETLYEVSEGDFRRVINLLQASSSITPAITSELLNTLISAAKPADIKIVLEYALAGDFIKAKEKLLDVMLKESVSGTDIIKSLQKEIWNLSIEDELKVRLTEKTGEVEFRMIEGSDEFIQLESLLASFVLAGKGIVK